MSSNAATDGEDHRAHGRIPMSATVQLGRGDALAVLSSPMSLPTSGMVDPDQALTHIRAALPDPRQHLARFVPYALIRRIT
jgi:hypothetical protein